MGTLVKLRTRPEGLAPRPPKAARAGAVLLQLWAPHRSKPPLRVPALDRGFRNALDSRCIGLRLGQEVARRQLSGLRRLLLPTPAEPAAEPALPSMAALRGAFGSE